MKKHLKVYAWNVCHQAKVPRDDIKDFLFWIANTKVIRFMPNPSKNELFYAAGDYISCKVHIRNSIVENELIQKLWDQYNIHRQCNVNNVGVPSEF